MQFVGEIHAVATLRLYFFLSGFSSSVPRFILRITVLQHFCVLERGSFLYCWECTVWKRIIRSQLPAAICISRIFWKKELRDCLIRYSIFFKLYPKAPINAQFGNRDLIWKILSRRALIDLRSLHNRHWCSFGNSTKRVQRTPEFFTFLSRPEHVMRWLQY